MIEFLVTIQDRMNRVRKSAEKAGFRNFKHAAARIRKDAMASIKRAPKELRSRSRRRKRVLVRRARHAAAPPGHPPYTQRGQLKRAIIFAADEKGAMIGPRASVVGPSGEAHEFGGRFRGQQYPQRPFMGPAMEKNLARFAREWSGSIGEY